MARSLLDPRDMRDDITRKKLNQLTGREPTSVITTPVTLTDSDHVVLVDDDTVGSAVTVNLPAVADSQANIYHIKKLGSTANVIIDASGSETIDGSLTATITVQYESLKIYCDGSAWYII